MPYMQKDDIFAEPLGQIQDFRFDDWLLYAVDSPSASGGRGLVRGQFYNRAGILVASTIQEGVIRAYPTSR